MLKRNARQAPRAGRTRLPAGSNLNEGVRFDDCRLTMSDRLIGQTLACQLYCKIFQATDAICETIKCGISLYHAPH